MHVTPIDSLGGLLTGHWALFWVDRIGPGLQLIGAGTETQGPQLGPVPASLSPGA